MLLDNLQGFLKTLLIAAAACLIYGVASGIRANYGIMLGCICVAATGSYSLIWCVSMALSFGAALLGFTIRENA